MLGIITLTHNCLSLTQNAIHSFLRQDITDHQRVWVVAIDNGSTDGSDQWLRSYGFLMYRNPDNAGVSSQWNRGLNMLFGLKDMTHVLVAGNDTWLPPYFVRELLWYDLPFVTGVAVDKMEQIQPVPSESPLDPHPDFSAFLISRDCWEKVGPFNERMKLYASDCDFHIRAHKLGIPLWKASCEFFHERSSTLRNAPQEERDQIQGQANRDRSEFYLLHGCLPGTLQYEAIFAQSLPLETAPVQELHGSTPQMGKEQASDTPSVEEVASAGPSRQILFSSKQDPETFDSGVGLVPEHLPENKRP